MKLNKSEIKGIHFYYREGFSDLKTFEEVIGRDVYQKKDFKIESGEKWMDCGGNVGAFALLALSKGAIVDIFEPDPFNCKLIEKNLKLNNFNANIFQKALVHDEAKSCYLFVGNNNQVWRNSIVKKWNNKGLKVDCINFDKVQNNYDCCKMDIEGAEMLILETYETNFKKLVYEWSFDIDQNIDRLRNVLEKQKKNYPNIYGINKVISSGEYDIWQKNWFPLAVNIYLKK